MNVSYYNRHKDKVNAYTKQYRKSNPARVERWKDLQAAGRLAARGYISIDTADAMRELIDRVTLAEVQQQERTGAK